MPSPRAMRHSRSEPLAQGRADGDFQTPEQQPPWPFRSYTASTRSISRFIQVNRDKSWVPKRLSAGTKSLKFHNMTSSGKAFQDTTGDRLQAKALSALIDTMEEVFSGDDAGFLNCMVRTYEWQEEQRGNNKQNRTPFLAYYWLLKYLSKKSGDQPNTQVQSQFMAWVQHWAEDKDFEQHVEPMWHMLSDIKNTWQPEAERDGSWDVSPIYVKDLLQPLSNLWRSAGAIDSAAVQPINDAQSVQDQHAATTTLFSADMQPADLDRGGADANINGDAGQIGHGQGYVSDYEIQDAAGPIYDDAWLAHLATLAIQADDGPARQLAAVSDKLLARYRKCKLRRDAASHAMLHCLRNMALGHFLQGSDSELAHAVQRLTKALDICKHTPVTLTGKATNADLVMKIGLVFELANVNFAFRQTDKSATAHEWLEESHRLVDKFVVQQAVRPASMHTHAKLCKEMLLAADCARARNDVKGTSEILDDLIRVLTTSEPRRMLLYLPSLELQSASCCLLVVCAAVMLFGSGWQVVLFLSLLVGTFFYWLNGIKLN